MDSSEMGFSKYATPFTSDGVMSLVLLLHDTKSKMTCTVR